MFWSLIIGMTLAVFLSRYLFLEPKLPLKINQTGLRLLSYSAPAVLAAVIAPLVFVHDKQLDLAWDNSYMIAAVAAAGLMIITKNTLLTASLSLVLFILINQ